MAGYPANPGAHVAAQIFLALCYLLFWGMAVHATLGIARTVAVKLPVRTDKAGRFIDLFPADYSPKLCESDGIERKFLKSTVLALFAFLAVASWTVVVYATYNAYDPWFWWPQLGDNLSAAIHTTILLGGCAWAIWRGWRRAALYSAVAAG